MKVLPVIFFLMMTLSLNAQNREDSGESVTDALLDDQGGDDNIETHAEELEEQYADPIDLNQATAEQLRQLFMLDEKAVAGLLDYRQKHGSLLSVYELQAVPGFTPDLIRQIKPYVTVEQFAQGRLPRSKTIQHRGHTYVLMRYNRLLERKQGFQAGQPAQRFHGSEGQTYFRFHSGRTGNYHIGLTLENDAGEQWRWRPAQHQYGFDFVSFHAQLQNRGPITNLILGDFSTQFGQGLTLGRNFGLGKGAETVTAIRRTNLGFLPYTSSGENGYLRGMAATLSPTKDLYLSGYYSSTRRDAYTNNLEDGTFAVTSFIETGLHRNDGEVLRRETEGRKDYGAILQYQHAAMDLGILYAVTDLTLPVAPAVRNYNQFAFAGRTDPSTGLYFNYNPGSLAFFSEIAFNRDGGYGATFGVTGSFGPRFDATLSFRKYSRSFHSWSRSAFGEASSPSNEEGFYFGWREQLNPVLRIAGYVDLFEFPWLRFDVYRPSSGHEELVRLTYDHDGQSVAYAQVKYEVKQANAEDTDKLYQLTNREKWSGRLDFQCQATPAIGFRSRIQGSTFQLSKRKARGLALVEDVNLNLHRFKASFRYAIFDTDSYDARLYVYERDSWLSFSLPAYYGSGIRTYALFQFDPAPWLTLWLRISHTAYADDTPIGSGIDKIEGSQKNDLKLQIRITPD